MVDEAWKRVDSQVFHAAAKTAQYLEQEFRVPVETRNFEEVTEQDTSPVELPAATKAALAEMLQDKQTLQGLRERTTPDMGNKFILELSKQENGTRALKEAQRLSYLAQTMKAEVLPFVVAEKVAGRRIFVDGGGMVVPKEEPGSQEIMEYAEKQEFRALSRRLSNDTLRRLMDYYDRKPGHQPLHEIILEKPLKNTVRFLMESRRFGILSDMDGHGMFANTYKKLFAIAGTYSVSVMEMLAKECGYIYLNCFADGSREIKALAASCTKASAEYLVLRYPEKYLISAGGKRVWKKSGMDGIITASDVSLIAENMESSVKRLCKSYQRPTNYTAAMIYQHLYAIYKYTKPKEEGEEKYPEKLRIKGLRTRLHQVGVEE